MRSIIQIIENGSTQQGQQTPELVGQIDVLGLAKLLGSVNDVAMFQSAISALQNGATPSPPQQVQLARAFISLLDATPQVRQQITTKLQTVGAPPPAAPQNDQS